jgi:hypothetical protein
VTGRIFPGREGPLLSGQTQATPTRNAEASRRPPPETTKVEPAYLGQYSGGSFLGSMISKRRTGLRRTKTA